MVDRQAGGLCLLLRRRARQWVVVGCGGGSAKVRVLKLSGVVLILVAVGVVAVLGSDLGFCRSLSACRIWVVAGAWTVSGFVEAVEVLVLRLLGGLRMLRFCRSRQGWGGSRYCYYIWFALGLCYIEDR